MSDSNWARVYTTTAPHKAEIAKEVLAQEGIKSVAIDKQDSAYGGVFGEIELYVLREDVIRARHLLTKKQL